MYGLFPNFLIRGHLKYKSIKRANFLKIFGKNKNKHLLCCEIAIKGDVLNFSRQYVTGNKPPSSAKLVM